MLISSSEVERAMALPMWAATWSACCPMLTGELLRRLLRMVRPVVTASSSSLMTSSGAPPDRSTVCRSTAA
ncbi:Uncharacterised protein [Mycobacteroides abscessus subsp. abscessus]|nr:Uncharacterised protein [Mycobacteroides abscessus subsp. abscessus]